MSREELQRRAQSVLENAYADCAPKDVPEDVFFWREGDRDQFLCVPWASKTQRAASIILEGEALINAEALPNGRAARSTTYAGLILRDATADYEFTTGTHICAPKPAPADFDLTPQMLQAHWGWMG